MTGMIRRIALAMVALALSVSIVAAQTRPLAVEDIVALEAFGRASIAPGGRWAVYEKRGAYDTVPNFDFGGRSTWAITDLLRVDLNRPDRGAHRLLPEEDLGLIRGAWSPSGEHMVVWRFLKGRLEIGIADVADRSVVWTGLTPDLPLTGVATAWLSDDVVALTIRPDGSLPAILRYYGGSQTRTAAAWERTRAGREPSRTVIDAAGGVATAEQPEPLQSLVLLDIRTGRWRTALQGRIADVSPSPDGRRMAVIVGEDRVSVSAGPLLQAQGAFRQRLLLIETEGLRTIRPIDHLDVAPHLLRWSPDARRVLVWARADDAQWTDGHLAEVGDDGGRRLPAAGLTPGSGADILRGVRADWAGSVPVIHARPETGGRFDWYALPPDGPPVAMTDAMTTPPGPVAAIEGSALLIFGDGALWEASLSGARRLSPAGQELRHWTEADSEKVMRLRVNDAPRRGWAVGQTTGGRPLIAKVDGTVRPLASETGRSARILAADESAALVLDRLDLVETLRLETKAGTFDLDHVNEALADVRLSQPVPLRHPDVFGRSAESWLFLPEGGAQSAVGLVVEVYPGAVDRGTWTGPFTLTYGTRAAVLAGQGYAVLTPAIPIDRPDDITPDHYVSSVDRAVDAALTAFPDLPSDRIAIQGHSFGGHAAFAIAARSKRYRSYIVSSAAIDFFGEWGEFIPATRILPEDGLMMVNQQGWVEDGQGAVGGTPWSDPDGYIARSPYLDADTISAPVLLMTADRDYVPMSQMERAFSALYRLGGKARLVTYWGEHHHVLSPANIRDRYGQILDWLEGTLGSDGDVGSARPAGPPTP